MSNLRNLWEDIHGSPINSVELQQAKDDLAQQDSLSVGDYIADIAAAPFRGVASAAEELLELPTIFGFDYDIPDALGLGDSKTGVGGFIQGVTQFGAGFVGTGGMGTAMLFGNKVSKLGKVGGVLAGGPRRKELVGATLQGAVVDAAFFDGNSGRLSDLINEYPSLENPITEFLSSKEGDSQAMGRLKNAVEGMGLGFLADSLFMALRGKQASQAAMLMGKSPQEAYQAGARAAVRARIDGYKAFGASEEEAIALHSVTEALGFDQSFYLGTELDGVRPPSERVFYQDDSGVEKEFNSVPYFFSPTKELGNRILGDTENKLQLKKGLLDLPAKDHLTFEGLKKLAKAKGLNDLKLTEEEYFFSGLADLIEDGNLTVREALEQMEEVQVWIHTSKDSGYGGPKFQEYTLDYPDDMDPDSGQRNFPEEAEDYVEIIIGTKNQVESPDQQLRTMHESGQVDFFPTKTVQHFEKQASKLEGDPLFTNQGDPVMEAFDEYGQPTQSKERQFPFLHIRAQTKYVEWEGEEKRLFFVDELQSDLEANARAIQKEEKDFGYAVDPDNPYITEVPEGLDPFSREYVQTPASQFLVTRKGKPNRKVWQNIGVKFATMYAARNGYDGVSFISGSQTARRWSADPAVGMWDEVSGFALNPTVLKRYPEELASSFERFKEYAAFFVTQKTKARPNRIAPVDYKTLETLVGKKEADLIAKEQFASITEASSKAAVYDDVLPTQFSEYSDDIDRYKVVVLSSDGAKTDLNPSRGIVDLIDSQIGKYVQPAPYPLKVVYSDGEKGTLTYTLKNDTDLELLHYLTEITEPDGFNRQLIFQELGDEVQLKVLPEDQFADLDRETAIKLAEDNNLISKQDPSSFEDVALQSLQSFGYFKDQSVKEFTKPLGKIIQEVYGKTWAESSKEERIFYLENGFSEMPFGPIANGFVKHINKDNFGKFLNVDKQGDFQYSIKEPWAKSAVIADYNFKEPRSLGGKVFQEVYDSQYGSRFKKLANKLKADVQEIEVVPGTVKPGEAGNKTIFFNREIVEELRTKPRSLMQDDPTGAKGRTDFFKDGSVVVTALKNADVSTAVHELGHVIRNFMYEAKDGWSVNERKTLESWAGVKEPGNWDVDAEEKFARAWEKYIRTGDFPEDADDIVKGAFETLKAALVKIYKNIVNSPIDVEINPAVKEIFDDLVRRGDPDLTLYGRLQRNGRLEERSLFQNANNPKAKHSEHKGKAREFEDQLIEQYGSYDAIPANSRRQLLKMIDGDPDYVPYDSDAAYEFLGFDTRPTPTQRKKDKRTGRRPGKFERGVPNTRRAVSDDDTRDLIQQRYRQMADEEAEADPEILFQRRAAYLDSIRYFHEIIPGLDTEDMQELMNQVSARHAEAMRDVLALREVHADYARDQSEVFKQIRDMREAGKAIPDQLVAKAYWLEEQLSLLSKTVLEANGRIGRGLSDLKRIPTGNRLRVLPKSPEDAAKFVADMKEAGENIDKFLDQRIAAFEAGADRSLAKLAHSTRNSWHKRILPELWYNSLLSGPKTIAVNFLATALNAVVLPIERSIGATGAKLGGQNISVTRELAPLWYMLGAARDSLYGFAHSYRKGMGQLDPTGQHIIDGKGFKAGKLDFAEAGLDGTARAMANFLYHRATMPTRLLGATDNFIKEIIYRSRVKTALLLEADSRGLAPLEKARWVEDTFDIMTDKGQFFSEETLYKRATEAVKKDLERRGIKPTKDRMRKGIDQYISKNWDDKLGQIARDALEEARVATFTASNNPELGHNPFSKGAQILGRGARKIAARFPPMRLIIPFINTPTNLVSFYMDRQFAPIWEGVVNPLRAALGKEIYGSPEARAQAVGRVATGTAMTLLVSNYVMQGRVTGGGPKDKNQRQVWLAAGNQPYSIKKSDGNWYSYARLDPFASYFGVVADIFEGIANARADEDTGMFEDALGATVLAFMRNIGEKTYLQGFTRFAKAIDDPEAYGDSYLRGITGALVPTGFSQINKDPYFREIRSIVDNLKARTPFGVSESLTPRRDVLGKPIKKPSYYGGVISPFAVSEPKSGVVRQEMARLQHGFSAPRAVRGPVDLRKIKNSQGREAYDRYLELSGELRIGGKTLEQALDREIRSRSYQRMAEPLDPSEENPKISALKKIITKYRGRAYKQLLREFPNLRQAEKVLTQNRINRRLGRDQQTIQNILNY